MIMNAVHRVTLPFLVPRRLRYTLSVVFTELIRSLVTQTQEKAQTSSLKCTKSELQWLFKTEKYYSSNCSSMRNKSSYQATVGLERQSCVFFPICR